MSRQSPGAEKGYGCRAKEAIVLCISRWLPSGKRPETEKARKSLIEHVWYTSTDVMGSLYPNELQLAEITQRVSSCRN